MCDIPPALLAAQEQKKGENQWLTDRDHSHTGHESPSVYKHLSKLQEKAILSAA